MGMDVGEQARPASPWWADERDAGQGAADGTTGGSTAPPTLADTQGRGAPAYPGPWTTRTAGRDAAVGGQMWEQLRCGERCVSYTLPGYTYV